MRPKPASCWAAAAVAVGVCALVLILSVGHPSSNDCPGVTSSAGIGVDLSALDDQLPLEVTGCTPRVPCTDRYIPDRYHQQAHSFTVEYVSPTIHRSKTVRVTLQVTVRRQGIVLLDSAVAVPIRLSYVSGCGSYGGSGWARVTGDLHLEALTRLQPGGQSYRPPSQPTVTAGRVTIGASQFGRRILVPVGTVVTVTLPGDVYARARSGDVLLLAPVGTAQDGTATFRAAARGPVTVTAWLLPGCGSEPSCAVTDGFTAEVLIQ